MNILQALNQPHLTLPPEGHPLYTQIQELDSSYPGGIAQYIANAKNLLQNQKNPYEGWTVEVPQGMKIDFKDEKQIQELEKIGMEELKQTCFVLVAGGLGERLGYQGIKVAIPIDLLTETSYLQYYISYILALQDRFQCKLQLAIMVSDDTHDMTLAFLEENQYFGMAKYQIHILKQQKVPALINSEGHLAQLENHMIETKPHGHGDVHLLLNQSGLVHSWLKQNFKWVTFFQDTNAPYFRSLPAVIGSSKLQNLEMNSVTMPRLPGEAVGAICRLTPPAHSKAHPLTLNIEYNQISMILPKEPVSQSGHSLLPGNINGLVFSLKEYAQTLEETQGLVAEFINPKMDAKGNFTSSCRLECMMQDYPKLLKQGSQVGFSEVERLWCFSPCKNNLQSAKAKIQQGLLSDSAISAEEDFYKLNVEILKLCGVEFEGTAYVYLHPKVGLTLEELRKKIKGKNLIKNNSTLILFDGFENLYLDGSLRIENFCKDKKVENKQYVKKVEVGNDDEQKYLIRGYKLEKLTIETI